MMTTNILVSAGQLNKLIAAGDCITVDCRFDLADPDRGRKEWLKGHIPGAHYAHLDDNLSAPIQRHTGRHPLPDPEVFARFLSSIGWSRGTLMVAYDAGSGALAGRLWWLMRYFGQPAALLDGGLAAWLKADYPLESGEVKAEPTPLDRLEAEPAQTVDTELLAENLESWTVIDARAEERFTGAVEPLDSEAGHIPGSLNRPLELNLGTDGRFKEPARLRVEFEQLLADRDAPVVHSCGSGVTACHNLFAMELAGMQGSRVYPGSWSEWIRDPARPIATGPSE